MSFNKPIKISLIQCNLFWKDVKKNLSHLDKLLKNIHSTDIIILPEMFNTGFCPEFSDFAETMNGITINWMLKKSKEKNCSIVGSLMIKENRKIYNRLIWVSSKNKIQTYDKRHLFSLANEQKTITKGVKKLFIQEKGWKIFPLICYDLRFPVFSRNSNDYDLLIYIANWPVKRIDSWKTLLKARAIENQCFTLGVNRVGSDNNGVFFDGQSMVFDAFGKKITTIPKNKEQTKTVVLKKEKLELQRRQMNFLKDRDLFTIHD